MQSIENEAIVSLTYIEGLDRESQSFWKHVLISNVHSHRKVTLPWQGTFVVFVTIRQPKQNKTIHFLFLSTEFLQILELLFKTERMYIINHI